MTWGNHRSGYHFVFADYPFKLYSVPYLKFFHNVQMISPSTLQKILSIYEFPHPLSGSSTHALTRPFTHPPIHSCAHTPIHSSAYPLSRSHAHPLIPLSTYQPIHSSAHTLIHSSAHTPVHSFANTLFTQLIVAGRRKKVLLRIFSYSSMRGITTPLYGVFRLFTLCSNRTSNFHRCKTFHRITNDPFSF